MSSLEVKKKSDYYLNEAQAFVIENYNRKKPFASFLPAVAGLYGKPMWVYYVNRGQSISTIGVNNKNYSIMEFQPANKAYRYTPTEGFRTFIKIKDTAGGKITYYEPFQDLHTNDPNVSQKMYITSYDLRLEETNQNSGLKFEVMYCTLPGDNLSSLIRELQITNLSGKTLELEVLDGLPVIIPYYLINQDLKNESNLRQAWMGVENYDSLPFYKIKVLPYDTPETLLVEGGNFYLNFDFTKGQTMNLSQIIVDPSLVFDQVTDFSNPDKFFQADFSVPEEQVNIGVTPCGFGYKKVTLPSGGADKTFSLIGSIDKYDKLVNFVQNTLTEDYLIAKIAENNQVIESLKSHIFTSSSSVEFDLYCGQTFLDNILRGGYPILTGKGKNVFYVYSRQHGDLEREYNFFQIDATNFSQGNAHFRDINQNRRNDVCFFPFTEATNIHIFFNLLQLDGFNALLLKGSRFGVADFQKANAVIDDYLGKNIGPKVQRFITKPFTPGDLLMFMEHEEIRPVKGYLNEFMGEILAVCDREDLADFKEGYWVDHWTYNNDLLEQFIAIFPDKVIDLLFAADQFTYFDNYELVMPRSHKYVLTDNGVRQQDAVVKNPDKERMIKERTSDQFKVRTGFGKGEVYKCSLLSKLICLVTNKIASLDPGGIGVEMESNKPGWCDALNGLPAILGSSINESMEIKRVAQILLDSLATYQVAGSQKVKLPEEVYTFYQKLRNLLLQERDDFKYWDLSYQAKEEYREKTSFGISGNETEIDIQNVTAYLNAVISKVDRGLEKAYNSKDGMYYTYFINEVVARSSITDSNGNQLKNKYGYPLVKALKFKQRPIPYFLEGPVHILRVEKNTAKARSLSQAIQKSGLYDERLGMYKVNDNIMDETREIGRQNVFPRGWLENEAVFLHMEYKYLLELLRCGLYDEYFAAIKKALIPFLDPAVYGRSILENSSFIAGSVHPNKNYHGTGFQSRLTGASAEFLNMWLYMTAGKKPFYLDNTGRLCLEFKPVLPGWLFTDAPKDTAFYKDMRLQKVSLPANTFAFSFSGSILTVYHNPAKKDTFGEGAVKIRRIILHKDNQAIPINDGVIQGPTAVEIRAGLVDRIDIFLE
jgi:hypothetical protein